MSHIYYLRNLYLSAIPKLLTATRRPPLFPARPGNASSNGGENSNFPCL